MIATAAVSLLVSFDTLYAEAARARRERDHRVELAKTERAYTRRLAAYATANAFLERARLRISGRRYTGMTAEEWGDMLATIGTSMLGLTIGCARCHDHKFDAFPQADYYRLLATFTTTVRSEINLNMDPEGYRQAKAGALQVADASRLANILALLGRLIEGADLEERIRRLEETNK